MPIRCYLRKVAGGPAVLTVVRSNGMRTAARIGEAGADGPVHDFAQFVVERALGLNAGFLGLLSAGWKVKEFDTPEAVRHGETDAVLAECVARHLSREVRSPERHAAEFFNARIAWAARRLHPDISPPALTDAQLDAMRRELAELRRQWVELPVGGTLDLSFAPVSIAQA